jgi:hypothetical protein
MNRGLVFCLLLLINSNLQAASGGIEESNYSLYLSALDSDYSNNNSLGGVARVPISDYTGLSISAQYSDSRGKGYFFDNFDHSSRGLALGFILRDFSLGVIGASYDYTTLDIDSEYYPEDVDLKTLSIGGTLYLSDFEISFERERQKFDDGEQSNGSNLGLHYYISDRLRVGATYGGMDAEDVNDASIIYQPKILGDALSLSFSYIDVDPNPMKLLTLTYYLNARVSLKERIRRY